MDINEYIASGVVEMYNLGALEEAEKTEFEQRVLMYPELARELSMVQVAMSSYAKAFAINPRPELRSEILKATLNATDSKRINKNNVSNGKDHSLTYKYLIAASLAALAISTFASWFFYSRWEDSEERFSELLSEKNQLAQNYNLVKSGFDKTVYDMLVMRDENSQVINLQPKDTSLNFKARIYWNKLSREIFLDVIKLPEPNPEQEYQLWAVLNNEPLDAGSFNAHEFTGLQRMKEINAAEYWLVTLESKDSLNGPTLDRTILVSGIVPSDK